MQRSKSDFRVLADQAVSGDSSARGELRRKLEPEMIRIVRRVIQVGAGRSAIDHRILAEARRVGLDAESATSRDGEILIQKVARFVSALFVDRLAAKPLDRQMVEDTVCI